METWSSKIGFLLAAIGSAVGIGNIWRFSSIVGQNGGGAYLIPFFIAVFFFAVPLIIMELNLGSRLRATIVTAFGSAGRQFRFLGWMVCAIVFLILSYYLVITGWTLGYVIFSAAGVTETFDGFTGTYLPVAFFVASTLAAGAIVSLGVRRGVERSASLLIPVSFVILVLMAIFTATLPGFAAGIAFFLTPDFSVLADPLIWSAAFGQAFFSLAVGWGILITFGGYLEEGGGIPRSALIITFADLFVALLAGMVIFPIVFTFGLEPAAGAELAFSTLPRAFDLMPSGRIFAVAFFALLFFAALTSVITMLEVNVVALIEATRLSRRQVSGLLTAGILIAGMPAALSYSAADLTVLGIRILDIMDDTLGTLGLPISALMTAVVFTWFFREEVFPAGEYGSGLLRLVYPICKYAVPAVLTLTIAARLLTVLVPPGGRGLPDCASIDPLAAGIMVVLVLVLIAGGIAVAWKVRGWRPPRPGE
ncbi:MAG: sodium-dependent transporter [Methanomicrobiaceae archaeon]|uniref:Sodium-dependent transporter n=1 Tax=hydrocarbon metagenome TaxID=938273 RepID=A0A0W8FHT6_9ZZZZ|nr:sodium-dependent transporter [Methanomicrobiaceae archaeon]